MSAPLEAVPSRPPSPDLPRTAVVGEPPAPGPADVVAVHRLRRAITEHLGEVPNLQAHLGLLDARGAWYGWHAAPAWDPDQGEALFGVIRHVVRTQLSEPPPAPDVEGWVAAGRPRDPLLALVWGRVVAARWPGGGAPVPLAERAPGVAHPLDEVLAAWPADGLDGFIHAYAVVEAAIEDRGIPMPSVTA